MKLAYSSVCCPGWNLATIVEKAKEYGYQGIELRGLQGQLHLPMAPELATHPVKVGELIRAAGVELVCLGASAAFHMRDPKAVAENQDQVREYIELAGKLGCPYVRVHAGEIPRGHIFYERREDVLSRIAAALRPLSAYAAQHRVTLVIENGGDFVDSAALWYLVDAVESPAVKCCWNPFAARTRNERPTTSIPRLGAKVALVHLSDGKFDTSGGLEAHALPGQGNIEIPRLIQLLKGMAFQGFVVFDWPKLWVPSLADPDRALPAAATYLRKLLDEQPVPMSAYKGDKHAPRQGLAAAAT